jgi:hypothetical protein
MPQGVCINCIVLKTGGEPEDVRTAFHRLGAFIRVIVRQGRCGVCPKRTTLLALAPATPTVGDLVTSRLHPDWVGEVVDAAKTENGRVAVRWRSPSGVLLRTVEESVDGLALLRPRMEHVATRQ